MKNGPHGGPYKLRGSRVRHADRFSDLTKKRTAVRPYN
jgi:hypothetical protein